MIYRKRGSVARWENGTLIRVTECGVAVEDGEQFECFPDPSPRAVEEAPAERVARIAQSLRHLPIERLIVTHGIAEHECDGREWREESERFHASLVVGGTRALVDATTDRVDELMAVADALRRAGAEREAPPRLRLAPNVTAALLPSLVGLAPPNVRLLQSAGGVDGYGRPIVETADDWPSFYRPSYRVRPVRMPLNLRLECDVTEIDPSRPIAVALLAPVEGLVLRVLVADGDDVYPATVRIARVDAVADSRIWYPYGGGSFGAEMML